jgi:UDP-N-acetylmuramoyl-L-alanyl-D-glutamate--2,6-diaminopimelate ligase
MALSGLVDKSAPFVSTAFGDVGCVISSIEYNSAKVGTGSLFVAIEGAQTDGHAYVRDAIERGAGAVVVSQNRQAEFADLAGKTTLLAAADTRRALSVLSAAFYGFPSSGMLVLGVTGTNGKTSITYMLESIFKSAGRTPGVIGTVNYRWKGGLVPAPNTTPESRDVHEIVRAMADDGVDALVMEVSSHGLKLGRVEDVEFDAGIFTNLTRDHLDFHLTFEDYFASKLRLFDLIDRSKKSRRAGIVNCDDEYGRTVLSGKGSRSYPLFGFGLSDDADYRPEKSSIRNSIDGVSYRIDRPPPGTAIDLHVAGGFHVYNSLAAFAAAHAIGIAPEAITAGLSALSTVPGRFDRLRSDNGYGVIVDYAHTDDALAKLLQSARELSPRRIITVFGCGGNRDRTKRPLMGETAAKLSDVVIVTSDNPRKEEPGAIIGDILAGMKGARYDVEPDRERAIAMAIEKAGEGDIVVIAGKGHEDYQIIGTEKRHFDDREIAMKYIAARAKR